MVTAKKSTKIEMLPYRRQEEIDYANLDFAPDVSDWPPDHMEQNREIFEIVGIFKARFTDFDRRPDVFLDHGAFICYDPSNLNVRVAPDVCLSFGVDTEAIRPRKLYLPWEAGKPPDWVLGSPRKVPPARMSIENRPSTPESASRSIGASTPRAADTTGGRWAETAWSTACTSPSN